jgi:ribosomal protein S18 acetylase RimI-like enzyme
MENFQIEIVGKEYINEIITVVHGIPESEESTTTFMAFSSNEIEDVFKYYNGVGCVAYSGEIPAACGFIWFPQNEHVHSLGEYFDEYKQPLFAQLDNTVVLPQYRGYSLQNEIIKSLESETRKRTNTVLATVSPENEYSLRNLTYLGYEKHKSVLLHNKYERIVLRKIIA